VVPVGLAEGTGQDADPGAVRMPRQRLEQTGAGLEGGAGGGEQQQSACCLEQAVQGTAADRGVRDVGDLGGVAAGDADV
jgi:hypothetical protein